MARKGEKAPGTGWGNPNHPMHNGPKGKGVVVPFTEGNTAAVKAGWRSRDPGRLVMAEAQELAEQITAEVAYLQDASYAPAVNRWATAEAWCQRLSGWLEEHGAIEAEGKVKPVLDALRTWQARASAEADRLGLTPLARARLGKDVAATKLDVARLWAEMAEEDDDA